jgi:hypothetical protein
LIDESNTNAYIILDTTTRSKDTIKSWKQVYEILEKELCNSLCLDDLVEEDDEPISAKLRHVAKSELHKLVARPKLMPYTDMIGWALEHVDIPTRSIFSHKKTLVISFRPRDIQVMYKLSSKPKYTYNSLFILNFEDGECTTYDRNINNIMKHWWGNPSKFKFDTHGVYSTTSCDSHIMCISMILCRMFIRFFFSHFTIEWVPIIHKVVEGYTFDWGKMLSENLAKEIVQYKMLKSKGEHAPFYMSAFIMDAICFRTPFPLMNSSWTSTSINPIQFYRSKLWEEN